MITAERQITRFKDAPWLPQHNEAVFIGGSGGIGSWLALCLSRIGFNVNLYDFDLIEEHNLGGQLFKTSDIGSYKVDAVARICMEYSGVNVNAHRRKIDMNSPTHHYMFSAFDNMVARKEAFEVWKRSIPGATVTPIFIDGRLEMEQLQIFCVTPDCIAEYEKHLFDDAVVEDLPCTMKQTSHSAMMIASHMTAFFTNHLTNIYEGEKFREVPFYYEYVIPMSLTEEKR